MQFIKVSESTAARRRIYFTAVDENDLQQRITGLDNSELVGKVSKNGASAATDAGSFVEVDAGDSPGLYYYEFTSGEVDTLGVVTITITGTDAGSAATMEPRELAAQVVAIDIFDTVRFGLTALPNAAAEASGGMYTRGTGAGQINQSANGQIDVNVEQWRDGVPSTLSTGRVRSFVEDMDDNVITADALEAGGVAEIAAAAADAVWDEARASHVATGSFGEGVVVNDFTEGSPALTTLAGATGLTYINGTALAGGATTIDFAGINTDDFYNGGIIYLYNGTGFGQARTILDWDFDAGLGGNGRATVAAWTTNPDNTTRFVIFLPASKGISSTVDANVVSWSGTTVSASGAGTKHPLLP